MSRGSPRTKKRDAGQNTILDNSSATYLHTIGDAHLESQASKTTDDCENAEPPSRGIVVDTSFAQIEHRE